MGKGVTREEEDANITIEVYCRKAELLLWFEEKYGRLKVKGERYAP